MMKSQRRGQTERGKETKAIDKEQSKKQRCIGEVRHKYHRHPGGKTKHTLSTKKQLELYEGRYQECHLTAQLNEAIKACEEIQKILEELNESKMKRKK